MKTRIVMFGMILSFLAVSCNKDKNDFDNNNNFTDSDASINAKIDIMNDDTSQIIEDQLTTSDGITGKTTQVTPTILPQCATITRVPDYGTQLTPGTLITKTIDFGTDGCKLPNGNILKGKIIITFTYQPDSASHTINYQFVNFYHNDIKFNGNKTFTRVLKSTTINATAHPVVTMNMDMSATFTDGKVYNRVGTREREIIAGYDTPTVLTDNVYQVTGSWTTTSTTAATQTSKITTPLIIKLSCPHIVQGIITFTRNDKTATLDYGNGDCDNKAVFTTNNGTTYNIVLGR